MYRLLRCTGVFVALTLAGMASAELIDGEELVDPTRPFLPADIDNSLLVQELIRTVVPASFDLSFIRAGSSSPMAVINQQRVTIGDVIGGAEVIAIDRSSVTLLIDEEERLISLYDVSVKAAAVSQ